MPQRTFIALICLCLSACSQNNQIKTDLSDLAERLESFTELSIDLSSIDSQLTFPAKPKLRLDIPQLNIALREFYAIDDCPLGQFIAERNTALGKTQLPSTRFLYEKRLLTTLQNCLQQLPRDHLMHEQLDNWIAHKRSNLPMVWANMMTQSDEAYLAFTTSGGYISGQSDDGLQATKLALQFLFKALEQEQIDSEQLELHLKELHSARLPAKMWRTQALLTHYLPPMSNLLRDYIAQNQGNCQRSKREELKVMRNIFTMFFADKVQPLASQLNHYQYQLNPSFEALSSHQNIPAQWQAYIAAQYIDSAQLYKTTMQSHIALWQEVFKLCE